MSRHDSDPPFNDVLNWCTGKEFIILYKKLSLCPDVIPLWHHQRVQSTAEDGYFIRFATYILLLKKASREICGAVSGYASGQVKSRMNALLSSRSPIYCILLKKGLQNNSRMCLRSF